MASALICKRICCISIALICIVVKCYQHIPHFIPKIVQLYVSVCVCACVTAEQSDLVCTLSSRRAAH